MMRDDQKLRASGKLLSAAGKELASLLAEEKERAKQALAILNRVVMPSAECIGLDGSRALWLIALHNWQYHDLGKRTLDEMQELFSSDKSQVFYPGIPYLTDRIMVGSTPFDHGSQQVFGTQRWRTILSDGTVKSGRYPIMDRKGLGKRLREYGLATNTPGGGCAHNHE